MIVESPAFVQVLNQHLMFLFLCFSSHVKVTYKQSRSYPSPKILLSCDAYTEIIQVTQKQLLTGVEILPHLTPGCQKSTSKYAVTPKYDPNNGFYFLTLQ